MAKNTSNVWVVLDGDGWGVRREGGLRITKHFTTQAGAIEYGVALAKNDKVELIIQDQHGRIRDRRSYGNDPYPPRG